MTTPDETPMDPYMDPYNVEELRESIAGIPLPDPPDENLITDPGFKEEEEEEDLNEAVNITTPSDDELRNRRQVILDKLGVSLEELRERANNYTLAGDEHEAWTQLESIAFLLGETCLHYRGLFSDYDEEDEDYDEEDEDIDAPDSYLVEHGLEKAHLGLSIALSSTDDDKIKELLDNAWLLVDSAATLNRQKINGQTSTSEEGNP